MDEVDLLKERIQHLEIAISGLISNAASNVNEEYGVMNISDVSDGNVLADGGLHGRFSIAEMSEPSGGSATIVLDNGYYRLGGKTYEASSLSTSVPASSILAVKVSLTGSQPTATLETYESLSALKSDEADTNYYIMPLYQFDGDLNVVCDFRVGPDAAAWEFSS